jgi:hypothetical protein
MRLGSAGDCARHPLEDEQVRGHQRIPVEQSPDTLRVPVGSLGDPRRTVSERLQHEVEDARARRAYSEIQRQPPLQFE